MTDLLESNESPSQTKEQDGTKHRSPAHEDIFFVTSVDWKCSCYTYV